MEQEGRSDITAHPLTERHTLSMAFEIKTVSRHAKRQGKHVLKSHLKLMEELEKNAMDALAQLESRQYRARAPLHVIRIHEFGLAFAGKFCIAASRTFQSAAGDDAWQEVDHKAVVFPKDVSEMVLSDGDADNDKMDVDD